MEPEGPAHRVPTVAEGEVFREICTVIGGNEAVKQSIRIILVLLWPVRVVCVLCVYAGVACFWVGFDHVEQHGAFEKHKAGADI